jgi:hypothetical protein
MFSSFVENTQRKKCPLALELNSQVAYINHALTTNVQALG